MKKSLASTILMMSAFAAMADPNIRNEVVDSLTPKQNPCAKKYTIFKDEEGVIKTIEDYKLIKQGKSKKGKLKQQRIVSKINEWLESGYLTIEDLDHNYISNN